MNAPTQFCYCCQQHRKPEEMTGKAGRRPKCCFCVERSKTKVNPQRGKPRSAKSREYDLKCLVSGKFRPPH